MLIIQLFVTRGTSTRADANVFPIAFYLIPFALLETFRKYLVSVQEWYTNGHYRTLRSDGT